VLKTENRSSTVEEQPGQISFMNELARKATHLGALVMPVGYYLLQLEKGEMLMVMVPATVLMLIIDIARLRRWKFWTAIAGPIIGTLIRKHEEDGDFTGASYILLSTCFTVALYSKPVAIAALAFIIVGDAFAALIGRKFGRHKLGRRFGSKTWEGSLACLVGTVLVALVAPGLALEVALLGALVAAVVEAMPFGMDDNITVPIISGLFMTLVIRVLTNF